MKLKEKIKFKEFKKYQRGLIIVISFILTYGILMTSLISQKYSYVEGDIAREDIKATRDVVDRTLTEAATQKKIAEVPNQYVEKTEVAIAAKEAIEGFMDRIVSVKSQDGDDASKLSLLKASKSYNLADEDLLYLLSLSNESLTSFKNEVLAVLEQIYSDKIENEVYEDIINAQLVVDSNFNISRFNKTLREIGKTISYGEIHPNFFLDEKATEELKKQAANEVSPVVVKKNQTIVSEGSPISASQLLLLEDLGILNNTTNDWYIYLSLGILVGVIFFLQYYYLYTYNKKVFLDNSKLTLVALISIISFALARSVALVSPFMIPLASGPMLLTLLIDYKLSTIIGILNCVIISGIVDFNLEITLLAVVSTIMGALYLRRMQQRNDIMKSGLYIGIISAIIVMSIGMLVSNDITGILKKSAFTFVGNLFAGILTIGFLPFFESAFDVVTIVKLLELSNPNHPLLKKILIEAPGTYNHSIQVGNLAEMAAEEVGGNPVLARIASYYHDAGKIKRPYFFKENQTGRDNPHDKISPNLSTLIIISHVKDGLELAKEYNLPKVIQDVIMQHHGTTLVKYFYITMKNNSEKPEEVKEEDFRYPGPLPSSKESAIIMLADSVEAAVRSIPEPTKGKIEEMVNNIIKDKLHTGQLDNCELTLKDIDKIKKSFLKTLNSMYHSRIEYPSLKE